MVNQFSEAARATGFTGQRIEGVRPMAGRDGFDLDEVVDGIEAHL